MRKTTISTDNKLSNYISSLSEEDKCKLLNRITTDLSGKVHLNIENDFTEVSHRSITSVMLSNKHLQ